jgi:hypothetical protein
LGYGQVGLLASVPLLVGGALELPLGFLAGAGRRRRRAVLGGGIVFVLSLLATAGAPSFIVLLAFTALYPASGAFVSLTQAEAEQRCRAGGRARAAGQRADRRGVRVDLGAGGPGGRPGRGAGRVGRGRTGWSVTLASAGGGARSPGRE